MDKEIRSILEAVNFIKDYISEKLVTKDELQEVREEMRLGFRDLNAEVADIKRQLAALQEQTKNHAGFTKEIDHILSRVQTIEKHLGIISNQPSTI